MNLVASAILRGMVGASSSADLAGVPGNKRAKAQTNAAGTTGEPTRAPRSKGSRPKPTSKKKRDRRRRAGASSAPSMATP